MAKKKEFSSEIAQPFQQLIGYISSENWEKRGFRGRMKVKLSDSFCKFDGINPITVEIEVGGDV